MPEAGWYSDPADDTRIRFWDGQRWTGSTSKTPHRAAPADIAPEASLPAGGTGPRSRAPFGLIAAVAAVVIAAAASWMTMVRHGSVGSSQGAERNYLQAAHADLAGSSASNSNWLEFGRVVCSTYEQQDSPAARAHAIDRPDLVASADLRRQLFGEALNHLCPKFQLSGIKPASNPPGSQVPPTATTVTGSSLSIFRS